MIVRRLRVYLSPVHLPRPCVTHLSPVHLPRPCVTRTDEPAQEHLNAVCSIAMGPVALAMGPVALALQWVPLL